MIDPGNGIHPGIPFADYLRIPRLNNSDLKMIGISPAHYDHNQTTKREDSEALQAGRATHLACLEPERFRSTYCVYDGRRAGKDWEAFKIAQAPGAEILAANTYELAKSLSAAVRSNAMAAPYVSGGRAELTICWTHTTPEIAGLPGYSVECKGRLDFVPRDVCALTDIKTTRNAEPEAFGRQAFQLGYHVAAAWYVDAWKQLTKETRPFFLVAVEKSAPFVVQVYRVSDAALELGRATYRERLDRLNFCRKEARWPGYAEAVMELPLPRWAIPNDDDGEINEEAA